MNARTAREILGPALLGRYITTEPAGEYPGGRARVIAVDPDPAAPEIVFQVRHPTWRSALHGSNEMGIFEWEEIWL